MSLNLTPPGARGRGHGTWLFIRAAAAEVEESYAGTLTESTRYADKGCYAAGNRADRMRSEITRARQLLARSNQPRGEGGLEGTRDSRLERERESERINRHSGVLSPLSTGPVLVGSVSLKTIAMARW